MTETMAVKFSRLSKVVTLEIEPAIKAFQEAIARLTRSFREVSARPVERHAFTPDMDLRCSVPRCTLEIEAHR